MRTKCRIVWLLLVLAGGGQAQLFYNEARDRKAQEAAAAAREIRSGSVFDKELRNIEAIAKLQIGGQLDLNRSVWLTQVDAFTTWGDVRAFVDGIVTKLGGQPAITAQDRKARLEEIKKRQRELQELAQSLRTPEEAKSGLSLLNLDAGLSQLGLAESTAAGSNPNAGDALEQIRASLEVTAALFQAAKAGRDSVADTEKQLASLALVRESLERELLQAEERYLAALATVEARRLLEAGEVLQIAKQAQEGVKRLGFADAAEIERTLEAAAGNRALLMDQMQTLHVAASVAVRNELPIFLSDLRSTQETLRHAVRQDALMAADREQLLANSAQRIALYYQGGIKPGQIAELLYHLSGLVSLPVIAAK